MPWIRYDPKAVRDAITRKGLSAEDVARRTRGKVSGETIRRLQKGTHTTCESAKLEVLAHALSLDVEVLRSE
jgi:hypothetical protein